MRRRITLLMATAIVASMVIAGPAQAGVAKQCDRSGGQADNQEVGCCYKKADSKRQLNKCLKFHT